MNIYHYIAVAGFEVLNWLGLVSQTSAVYKQSNSLAGIARAISDQVLPGRLVSASQISSNQNLVEQFMDCARYANNSLVFQPEMEATLGSNCFYTTAEEIDEDEIDTFEQQEWKRLFPFQFNSVSEAAKWISLYDNCLHTVSPSNFKCEIDLERSSIAAGINWVKHWTQYMQPMIRRTLDIFEAAKKNGPTKDLYQTLSTTQPGLYLPLLFCLRDKGPATYSSNLNFFISFPWISNRSFTQVQKDLQLSTIKEWKRLIVNSSSDISLNDRCTARQLNHYLYSFVKQQHTISGILRFPNTPLGKYYELSRTYNNLSKELHEFTELNVVQIFNTMEPEAIMVEINKYPEEIIDKIARDSIALIDAKLTPFTEFFDKVLDWEEHPSTVSIERDIEPWIAFLKAHLEHLAEIQSTITLLKPIIRDSLTQTDWPQAQSLNQCIVALDTPSTPNTTGDTTASSHPSANPETNTSPN
ncbi:hypothetical protein NEHOM01_1289 [Nematocida homosporus]|uniref:uncharacterized protein n=1 Tax=Nematocida homosporus TaxID=1912981 RepID=UPI00221F012B|nr:uncharacterized protein NEHOM01_1289 [Nematocida homosporus]KAI5186107.1 hypothetical protein NEHOM01_1289 [Nematocida homosporus]